MMEEVDAANGVLYTPSTFFFSSRITAWAWRGWKTKKQALTGMEIGEGDQDS